MSKALALQKALRAALIASPGLAALVPAANIIDRHRRPPPSPSIIIGEEVQAPDDGNINRDRSAHFHELHIWVAESGTSGAKLIAGAVQKVLVMNPRPILEGGYHLVDWHTWRVTVLRDPDGDMTHIVVTVRAIVGGGL